jgi:hypothetical protein
MANNPYTYSTVAAGGGTSIDGLEIEVPPDSSFILLADVGICGDDTNSDILPSLTALSDSSGGGIYDFTDTNAGEYGTNMNTTGGTNDGGWNNTGWNCDATNPGATSHWNTNGNTMEIFVEFDATTELQTVQLYFLNSTTYIPDIANVVFKDMEGNTLTPAMSPTDFSDYFYGAGTGGSAHRAFKWTF